MWSDKPAGIPAGTKVPLHRPGGPAQDSYAYGFEDQRRNGVRIIRTVP